MDEKEEVNEVRKKEEIGDALRGRHEVVSGGPFAVTSNVELRATVVLTTVPPTEEIEWESTSPPKCVPHPKANSNTQRTLETTGTLRFNFAAIFSLESSRIMAGTPDGNWARKL
ncbi:hypothetical protein DAPPUDRAFT_108284 [Daphnia pulex]|uniref:Uncharacterized protein n=1 Tax=Daphnia pulex TaxID=6669 RepID=E9GZP6_DAPPU|nr:hypothetical protein DAPPUDRAFT_108284 [Daphnia pulex]|eukprot:EFX75029.1 hypothetical protein DAPPUDRAFT_108284 [Daphnia pulex]